MFRMWRLLPPMPHPTSTICGQQAAGCGVRAVAAAAADAAPHIHHLRGRKRQGAVFGLWRPPPMPHPM
jgi:hypothetical protein